MYLFMFSLGLFEKQVALPSSYFGRPTPEGAGAHYLVAYRRAFETPSDRLVARLENGAVYERRPTVP